MNSFYEHHKDSINWHYRCFDRILLNGLILPFQQPERVVGFFSTIAPSRHAQIARSHRRIRPRLAASRSRQPLQSSLSKPEPTAKSP
jgi:hypothetical protein